MLYNKEFIDVSVLDYFVTIHDSTEASDAHCPGLTAKSTTQVQKVVFKVPVNLM